MSISAQNSQSSSTPAQPDFEKARARFPSAAHAPYLDVASRSLMPESAMEIATRHLRDRMDGQVDKDRYFEVVESARARFAALIGAQPCEIAITKNVSEGLNIIASSMEWKAGDEILLCTAIEHPANIYPWRNLERQGVRIRDFPTRDGLFPLDAVLAAIAESPRAKLVTVPATSFKPGFRTDLDTLGAACRAAGVLLVVDGAQSVGVTHLDVSKTHVDALAVSTQKGLCSLYGMGFLYVRKEFAETLSPRSLARFGIDMPAAHEADYDTAPIQYRAGALRFDLGNYNFLAAELVDDALELLLSYGTQAIDRYVSGLALTLERGLAEMGAPVTATTDRARSNIICLAFPGREQAAKNLYGHLHQQGVRVAVRGNVVRFSIHLYNNASDITRALAVTGDCLQRSRVLG